MRMSEDKWETRCAHACCKSASITSPSSIDFCVAQANTRQGQIRQREWKRDTSAGVSVGANRSPSYTNRSDPTHFKIGTLCRRSSREERTRILSEAFLSNKYRKCARVLREGDGTDLSNLEDFFELHVCLYLDCDLYMYRWGARSRSELAHERRGRTYVCLSDL